ncbi:MULTISPECIES: hypothetical protein [unclassified Streptomyces]|uniref:hypothetical protein n=1 Tax=unclassified Streptomyces TaxID=2593676 RepID=UPI000AFEB36A|nr:MULTISPECIES: hypothetical protein [unclassified Streptomyces]
MRRHGPGASRQRRRRRQRRAAGALLLPLFAAVLAGCGIRSTQVPTDFGPAPSRLPCSLPAAESTASAGPGIPVQVFLLCSAQLVAVDRSVRIPDGTAEAERRVLVAQGLLDELGAKPSAAETEAGYSTDVQQALRVSGPDRRDPENTFRLSVRPQRLSPAELAQIICTFAGSEATAADDGTVLLGGPGTTSLNRYTCTTALRTHPSTEPPNPKPVRTP